MDTFPLEIGLTPQPYPFNFELSPSEHARECRLPVSLAGTWKGTREPPARVTGLSASAGTGGRPRYPEMSLVQARKASGWWLYRCMNWRDAGVPRVTF